MNPVITAHLLSQRSAVGSDQTPIERLSAMYNSLSRDVNLCKKILEKLLAHQTDPIKKTCLNKILVKCNKRLILVEIESICWIEAWGDYVRLHCSDKTHAMRHKFRDFEKLLNPLQFLRISRSAIVNIGYVRELEPLNHGDYLLTLANNTQLNMSRNYRDQLDSVFFR